MKFDKLGWIVAAAMGGGILGMGFQGAAPKFATVDMAKVFDDSTLTKSSSGDLQSAAILRDSIVKFIGENPAMLPADAEKYAALSTRSPMTDADKTEIGRINSDALAASNRQRDLATKAAPNADDMKALQDFSARAQQNGALDKKLNNQYSNDLQDLKKKLFDDAMDKVKDSIKKIAEKQGYTVVFSTESAPYASNDITKQAVDDVSKK